MLDVLEVYERPYNPKKPVICFDEKSKQLLSETRKSIPMRKGRIKRRDYEYKRHGTVNLFVAVEPKGKKRVVTVTRRRTKKDFAGFIKKLVGRIYKDAEKIVLVLDNLNTHTKETIKEILGKKEAAEICRKLEIHYTPVHASWLNMAEIEIGILTQQCLKRYICSFQAMQHQTAIWVKERNKKGAGINWQFTREKAVKKFNLGYG
jgi:transposase